MRPRPFTKSEGMDGGDELPLRLRYNHACQNEREANTRNASLLDDVAKLKLRMSITKSTSKRLESLKMKFEAYVEAAYAEWQTTQSHLPSPAAQQPVSLTNASSILQSPSYIKDTTGPSNDTTTPTSTSLPIHNHPVRPIQVITHDPLSSSEALLPGNTLDGHSTDAHVLNLQSSENEPDDGDALYSSLAMSELVLGSEGENSKPLQGLVDSVEPVMSTISSLTHDSQMSPTLASKVLVQPNKPSPEDSISPSHPPLPHSSHFPSMPLPSHSSSPPPSPPFLPSPPPSPPSLHSNPSSPPFLPSRSPSPSSPPLLPSRSPSPSSPPFLPSHSPSPPPGYLEVTDVKDTEISDCSVPSALDIEKKLTEVVDKEMNEVFPSDHSVPSEPLAMGDDGNLGEKGEGSEIVEGSEQVTGVRQISKASNSSLKRKLGLVTSSDDSDQSGAEVPSSVNPEEEEEFDFFS